MQKVKTLIFGFLGEWKTVANETIFKGIFKLDPNTSIGRSIYPIINKYHVSEFENLSYYLDWRNAFLVNPYLDSVFCNMSNLVEYGHYLNRISEYDLIVVLHTVPKYNRLLSSFTNKFNNRKAKLIYFVSGEYKNIQSKIKFADDITADYLCSQLPIESATWLYEGCKYSKVLSVPHALNPTRFNNIILKDKENDIGFRGDFYHNIIGDLERTNIIKYFQNNSEKRGLKSDINIKKITEKEL